MVPVTPSRPAPVGKSLRRVAHDSCCQGAWRSDRAADPYGSGSGNFDQLSLRKITTRDNRSVDRGPVGQDSPSRLTETAGWVMSVRRRAAMLKRVKRTKAPAPKPRHRTAAIMVVVVSMVITAAIVAGIYLMRRDFLYNGVSGVSYQ